MVIAVQVSMLGKKAMRKGPSSSIQFLFISLPAAFSFFMLKVTIIPLMVEMKWPMMFPQRAVEDCFMLGYVDPAGVPAVVQILMSSSCCQLGVQLSKVRVVANDVRLTTVLTRSISILRGSTKLGHFQKQVTSGRGQWFSGRLVDGVGTQE